MALTARSFLSVEEAAAILGITESRVRQMLRAGELHGEKLNERAWAVRKDSVDKAAKTQQDGGRGRPRSGAA